METIIEIYNKLPLKIQNHKEKPSIKDNLKRSLLDKDKAFIDKILKRDIEKTLNFRNLKNNTSLLCSEQSPRKNLIKISPTSTRINISNTQMLRMNSEKIKNLKSKLSADEEIPIKAPENVLSLLQFSNGISINKDLIGHFTYFIGPGNNDLLIRKIMKKKKGWVKMSSPHGANFIWTQVKKQKIFEILPRMNKGKKVVIKQKIKLPPLLPDDTYTPIIPNSILNPMNVKIYNRLEGNSELCNKKKLYSNMMAYYKSANKDPFSYIPLTFHITEGMSDPNFVRFISKFKEIKKSLGNDEHLNNCWLIKPGESTNRGNGISLSQNLNEISALINEKVIQNGQQRTFIIQKYIYRPMLYKNRKFDLRCYTLITCINNNVQGYFYKEGYLRTSSQAFQIGDITNKFIHLTNDAIQKTSETYGVFEDANKLSYSTFQDYIDTLPEKISFKEKVLPEIKNIVRDTVVATYSKLNPNHRVHTFEILGYDFMLDEFYRPWLIEVNTNPCLELSGSYLKLLIPQMIQHAFSIAIDQVFASESAFSDNKFELIFSEIGNRLN